MHKRFQQHLRDRYGGFTDAAINLYLEDVKSGKTEPDEIAQRIICYQEDMSQAEWDEMGDEDKWVLKRKHAIAIAHAVAAALNFNPTGEKVKAPIPKAVQEVADRLRTEEKEKTGIKGKQASYKTGFIYLVRLPDRPEYVKVGKTADTVSRLSSYHNAYPVGKGIRGHVMEFAGLVYFPRKAEVEVMKRLGDYHHGGEWFKVDLDTAFDAILDVYQSDEFGIPEILALPNLGIELKEAA